MIKPTIFREYDIRGIADEDLIDENVLLLGKGIGSFLKRNQAQSIVVGRDVRLSSERIRNALVKGLTSTGLDVVDVGEVTLHVVLAGAIFYRESVLRPRFSLGLGQ